LQLIDWWGQFKDPTLSYLIESALQTNPSIFQAIAKIKQAQANLQGSRSFLFPSVTGIGSAEVDKNTIVSTNTTGGTGDVFSNNGMTNGYSAGANMSWEIDLFGANRRAIEASEARYAASQQNWNDAKVSLATQVADVYVSIRQCQNLLLTYQEENKSRLATQNITELRVNAGFSPRTDGNQASGSLYQNSSTLAQQRGVCEKYANQLVALSGVSPTQLEAK
jgi:multidrug efflux system outer membrane protein